MPPNQSFTTLLGPLSLITAIFFLNFLSRVVLGPVLLPLQQDLGLSLGKSGLVFLVFQSGYALALLNSGWISSRLTHRRTILISTWTAGLAWIMVAMSPNLPLVLASLFCSGLASGLYLPSGVASITEITPSCHWGKAFAIHELAPSLAFISAPVVVEVLLGLGTWRTVYLLIGCCCLLAGFSYRRFGQAGLFPGQAPRLSAVRAIIARPAFWALTLFFILVVGGEVGVYNLVPAYLVKEHGLTRQLANLILAGSRVLSLVTAFATGWCIDHLGLKPSLGIALCAGGLTTIGLAWGATPWVVAMLALQPVFLVAYFPAGFAALSSISPAKRNDLTVSLTVTTSSLIGGGAVPALIAYLGERASFSLGFTGLGLCLASCALLIVFVDLNPDQQTE